MQKNDPSNDETKGLRDALLKGLLGTWSAAMSSSAASGAQSDYSENRGESSATRDLLITLLARAGKGKDEVVQVLAREIGAAVAAMLKRPLEELAKNHRLQVTIELVPKKTIDKERPAKRSKKISPKKNQNK